MTIYEKLHKAIAMGYFILPKDKEIKRKILFPPDSPLALYVEETSFEERKKKITMIQAESLIQEAAHFIN